MNLRAAALVWLGTLAVGAGVLFALQQQLAGGWLAFGTHPQVQEALEGAREDLRTLARLDPERETTYRERFDAVQGLLAHLRILEHNREALVRRYQLILGVLFAAVALLSAAVWVVRQGRLETRLLAVRGWLEALSEGREVAVPAAGRRRDTVGRIATMIEEVSRVVVRDRRRLRALRHLSAWQEAARRQAHEVKTPLAAARLELERLGELLPAGEARRRAASLGEELDRLDRFSREFTTFARLPEPCLVEEDLAAVVPEFVETFRTAWPNLRLAWGHRTPATPAAAPLDREMLRRVLVNLCDNASRAVVEAPQRASGTVEFTLEAAADTLILEVADDGPGVPVEIRERLFEPYVSGPGSPGMGLGLAISKKILLDHGGDLELLPTPAGTTFRLTLPRKEDP
jgi:nitrogen fixation/metabolism regulation signal transduction histidine kinase